MCLATANSGHARGRHPGGAGPPGARRPMMDVGKGHRTGRVGEERMLGTSSFCRRGLLAGSAAVTAANGLAEGSAAATALAQAGPAPPIDATTPRRGLECIVLGTRAARGWAPGAP